MTHSTGCLFLIGTFLCAVPAPAAEPHSDLEWTRTVQPADHIHMIIERDQRERRYALHGGVGAASIAELKPAGKARSMSRDEQTELRKALERFVRDNPGKLVDIR